MVRLDEKPNHGQIAMKKEPRLRSKIAAQAMNPQLVKGQFPQNEGCSSLRKKGLLDKTKTK